VYVLEPLFFKELLAAITTIDIVIDKGWQNLWLECDSLLVVQAFKLDTLIPWKLRNRWENVVAASKNIGFIVGHIYLEGNNCACRLALHDTNLDGFQWWDSTPTFVSRFFVTGSTLL